MATRPQPIHIRTSQVNPAIRQRLLQLLSGQKPTRKKKMTTPKKKKKPRVRHVVHKGDIVRFHSPLEFQSGVIGTVVATPSKNWCVVKGMGARFEDWDGQHWVVRTQKPTGKTAEGEPKSEYALWIRKVLIRVTEYVPPTKPPKLPTKVINTAEQLLEHMKSGSQEKFVYRPDDTTEEPKKDAA